MAEQRRVLKMHFELCITHNDLPRAMSTMRMFGIKFASVHPNAVKVRNAFAVVRTRDDWHRVLDQWY
jgi:hypothetical protein